MNYKSTKPKKSHVTNSYILNINEVYKDCGQRRNNFVSEQPEPIYAKNCNPKINYPYPVPNNIRCWDKPTSNERNNIVRSNIRNGGVICEFKPRTYINNKISYRFLNNYIRQPCDYVQDVETEFYLIHGENSSCSSKYWKDRHFTPLDI